MPPRFTVYVCPLCGYEVGVRSKAATITHPCRKRVKRGTPQPVVLEPQRGTPGPPGSPA